MNTYKVIFAKNMPITCELLPHHIISGKEYYYEQNKGHLIYAIIKAPNEDTALITANNIVHEVTAKVFGQDYTA